MFGRWELLGSGIPYQPEGPKSSKDLQNGAPAMAMNGDHQLRLVVYPIRVLYIPGFFAGLLNHQQYHYIILNMGSCLYTSF